MKLARKVAQAVTLMMLVLMVMVPMSASAATASFAGKVDVGGGISLYAEVYGTPANDKPTIVFDNGNGDDHTIWNLVAPTIAQNYQTVTYDRVGMGQSTVPADRSKVDYTAYGEATRLHTLITNLGIKGPIVLVGHSISGIYMREYQALFASQVKGIVFVEGATEHQDSLLFPEFSRDDQIAITTDDLNNGTSTPVELSFNDFLTTSSQIDAIQANDPLRHVPITVLSGANHQYPSFLPNLEQHWADRQAYIASLSNNSVHWIDPNDGHYLHQQNPQFVIDGINNLLGRIGS